MADIFVAAGGSGGASSDETTARAADVLSGKTYLGADTSDDVGAGAMPDNGALQKTLRAGESVTVPRGYHNGSGSVTAAPLAEQTPGNAAPGDIVAGTSAWVRGAKMDGTLVEREGEQPATGVTISDGLAHVGMLPGAYRKNGRYGTPEVKAPVDMVARAAGLDGTKMLQGYAPLGVPGQIPVFNTMGPSGTDPRGSLTTEYGIDFNARTLWMHAPAHNAYYMREDGHPHICMDSEALGDAVAQQVLQGCTFTSKNGMKIPGAIYRWPVSGDIGGQRVMDAHENTVFAGDYGARGRGVFMRMPGGSQIDPTCMWAWAPAPTVLPQNIRAGVSVLGVWGSMVDYAATCVPFDGARFDGVHLSGWAEGRIITHGRFSITGYYGMTPARSAEVVDAIGGTTSGGGEPAIALWVLTPSVALLPFRRAVVTVSYSTNATIMPHGNGVNVWAGVSRVNGASRNRTLEPIRERAITGQRAQSGRVTLDIPLDGVTEQGFLVVAAHGSNFRKNGANTAFTARLERVELIA
jgi:putative phage tail fiber protein|uniref:Uncharacterized protein n=1 Tax=Siphoviridae sp. ctB242 TaxID=2827800 RepID=A0A8S5T133_9CAUD|nr:MAG TPA: hypothetical protein [Siphoviridae sp. ctB242]